MQGGYVSETGVSLVDELLTRGGMDSMFYTISLILCSMAFGGIMEGTNMLRRIAFSIVSLANTTGRLVASSIATCIGMNIIAPDQYLSIIMPGRMYKNAFEEAKLAPKNLSRCPRRCRHTELSPYPLEHLRRLRPRRPCSGPHRLFTLRFS